MAGLTVSKVVQGEEVLLQNAIAGYVQGETAVLSKGIAAGVVGNAEAVLMSGVALGVVAGRDLTAASGGGMAVVAGRDLRLSGGGAGLVKAQTVSVQNTFVGAVLSGKTELGEGARVLLNTGPAGALGIGIGLGALLGALLARFLSGRKGR